MQYTFHISSPLGEILLAADDMGLVGLWFEGQKNFRSCLSSPHEEVETPVIKKAKQWLGIYFGGEIPDFSIPIHLIGTDFQKEVWGILTTIPYGQTMTYGEIAGMLSKKRKSSRMSAQAVGNAVGHNPISIIIPCHRVLGSGGRLTGYSGGVERKQKLLELESGYVSKS